jgi:cytochrome c oxidase assembly protein subunit 15
MACLVMTQVTLGAFTIWSQKAALITTFHVLTGAMILGVSVLLTLRAFAMVAPEIKARHHLQTA